MRRDVILGLLACNAMVALITLKWAFGVAQPSPSDGPPPLSASRPTLDRSETRLEAQTIGRYASAPLFRKNRAFPVAPQRPAASVANAYGPPQARGTILTSTDEKWVLLVHPNTQLLRKVALGGQFAGWNVEDISETSVTLKQGETTITRAIRP